MATFAQPPYHPHPSTSTYMARAVPQPGPATTEFQAVRDERPSSPGWPPQHHGPLIAFGAAAGAIAVPLLIVYAFVASDPDTAIVGRTLLLSAGLVLAVLAGCCFIAMLVVRSFDHAVIQGAEYGVGEVHRLESLHGELQAVSTHMAATVARLESVLGERVQQDQAEVQQLIKQQAELAAAMLEHLQRIETGVGQALGEVRDLRDRVEVVEQQVAIVPGQRVNGEQPAEEVGGELVPMPNSRAFQLGREVERRRWERHNGDS